MNTGPERRRYTFPRAYSLQSCTWYSNNSGGRLDDNCQNFDDDQSKFVGVRRRQSSFCITGDSVFESSPPDDKRSVRRSQPVNSSLQIGRRPRALGLKDLDLFDNPYAKYFRNAREASKNTQKSVGAESNAFGTQEKQMFSTTGQSLLIHKPSSMYKLYQDIHEPETKSEEEPGSYFPQTSEMNTMPGENTTTSRYLSNNAVKNTKKEVGEQNQDLFVDENMENINKRKQTNVLGFYDDEDSNISFNKERNLRACRIEEKSDNSISFFMQYAVSQMCKVTLVLFVLMFGLGIYVHVNPHSLCLHGEFQTNLSGFEEALNIKVYGQHLAKRMLISSLKSHMKKPKKAGKPLVFSLHGWTGTGKNFVSTIIVDHLFKHGSQSPFVHKIIVPHHFAHQNNVKEYEMQLRSWIQGNVTKCSTRNLFIFDEMDKIPHRLVKTIKPFLNHRGTLDGVDYSNTIFLFLSNSGGNMINNHVLNEYRKGKKREQIELRDLEKVFLESVNTANTWYQELVTSETIDLLVPFLPLEKSHVKQCIRSELIKKGYPVVESQVSKIADQMNYFPPDLQLFSNSGCKKVSSRVDVTVG